MSKSNNCLVTLIPPEDMQERNAEEAHLPMVQCDFGPNCVQMFPETRDMRRYQGGQHRPVIECPHCNFSSERKSKVLCHTGQQHGEDGMTKPFPSFDQEVETWNLLLQYDSDSDVSHDEIVESFAPGGPSCSAPPDLELSAAYLPPKQIGMLENLQLCEDYRQPTGWTDLSAEIEAIQAATPLDNFRSTSYVVAGSQMIPTAEPDNEETCDAFAYTLQSRRNSTSMKALDDILGTARHWRTDAIDTGTASPLASNEIQEAGLASIVYTPLSSSSSSSSSSAGKRSRGCSNQGSPDGDGDKGGGNKKQKMLDELGSPSGPQRLSCPFRKYCSYQFGPKSKRYHTCAMRSWDTATNLK